MSDEERPQRGGKGIEGDLAKAASKEVRCKGKVGKGREVCDELVIPAWGGKLETRRSAENYVDIKNVCDHGQTLG